ncbi:transcription antiterminator [Metabacillus sp. GX 13764]|uniref:glucose PTS transporter transcription antiterminator GlcT n=1 Tax=Metabacillus kandeliae TaxID=2900151 RepID=UPI001E296E8C|nr:transcription antiterminator [Metabacillus kandeliae]
MGDLFTVKKALNNNVLIAEHEQYGEAVLIGKGIGFGKSKGDHLSQDAYEKMFVLKNEKEQEQYMKLLPHIDEDFIGLMNDIIHFISSEMNLPLNEHIHIGLTDHLAFALNRQKQGIEVKNPFLNETKSLYPKEFAIAKEVVEMIEDRFLIRLPAGEVGFIALHIHGAATNKPLSEINQYSQLIARLTNVIEDSMKIDIDTDSVDYMRLIRHIRYTIDRVNAGEKLMEPEKITNLLKNEYPLCYTTAWKLVKVMQQALKKPVYEAEAVYLTMHLYRLSNKIY